MQMMQTRSCIKHDYQKATLEKNINSKKSAATWHKNSSSNDTYHNKQEWQDD